MRLKRRRVMRLKQRRRKARKLRKLLQLLKVPWHLAEGNSDAFGMHVYASAYERAFSKAAYARAWQQHAEWMYLRRSGEHQAARRGGRRPRLFIGPCRRGRKKQ